MMTLSLFWELPNKTRFKIVCEKKLVLRFCFAGFLIRNENIVNGHCRAEESLREFWENNWLFIMLVVLIYLVSKIENFRFVVFKFFNLFKINIWLSKSKYFLLKRTEKQLQLKLVENSKMCQMKGYQFKNEDW